MENASQKVPVTLNLWIPSRGTFCVIDFDETLLEKFASVEKMSPVCVIKNVSLLFEQKMVETETQANLLMSLESHLLQYNKRPVHSTVSVSNPFWSVNF